MMTMKKLFILVGAPVILLMLFTLAPQIRATNSDNEVSFFIGSDAEWNTGAHAGTYADAGYLKVWAQVWGNPIWVAAGPFTHEHYSWALTTTAYIDVTTIEKIKVQYRLGSHAGSGVSAVIGRIRDVESEVYFATHYANYESGYTLFVDYYDIPENLVGIVPFEFWYHGNNSPYGGGTPCEWGAHPRRTVHMNLLKIWAWSGYDNGTWVLLKNWGDEVRPDNLKIQSTISENENAKVRVGIDTTGDGIIDKWTSWYSVTTGMDVIDELGFEVGSRKTQIEFNLATENILHTPQIDYFTFYGTILVEPPFHFPPSVIIFILFLGIIGDCAYLYFKIAKAKDAVTGGEAIGAVFIFFLALIIMVVLAYGFISI